MTHRMVRTRAANELQDFNLKIAGGKLVQIWSTNTGFQFLRKPYPNIDKIKVLNSVIFLNRISVYVKILLYVSTA